MASEPDDPKGDALPELPAGDAGSFKKIDADADPATSGSVDVAVSAPDLPRHSDAEAREIAAQKVGESKKLTAEEAAQISAASGSIDVAMSGGIPQATDEGLSQPVSKSGAVAAVAQPGEASGPVRSGRAKRVTGMVQDALSGGVEKLGQGIGVVGEGVAKLGDLTNKVPLVGAGIGAVGEGITRAGESIHALPRVAQTRRGRLLVRSVIVGFLLVFTWITVIVWFQVRSHDTPDFRPEAERILRELGKGRGSISQVYERASPRFQELVKKERFIDDMMDMTATNGTLREISAINETLVTTGPTGRVGRVGITASFERGISRGSLSFHHDKGTWKLLGIGLEVPEDVEITQAQRQLRVAACVDDKGKDVSDQRRKCDVRDAAETILEMIRAGRAGEVWDAANDVFKQQDTRERFIQIQAEQRDALGAYERILDVTDARAIGGVTATFDVLCEFERTSGVRVEFDFTRSSKFESWKLARFKITLPMPRAYEEQPTDDELPPSPTTDPQTDPRR